MGSMCGSSNTPSGQTVITQNKDPWSGVQEPLKQGFGRAETLFNTPVQQYPNSTVVPFSNQSEQAMQATENRANAGSPLVGAAQGEMQKTLGGDYLNAGNPAFEAMGQRISNAIRPRIDSQFEMGGRYGSGAHEEMLTRSFADAMAPLAYQNYENERGNMQNAAQQAPAMAMQDYVDPGMLGQVGAQREGQAGAQLQDAMSKFNFGQQEPRSRLAEYMATIGGGQYGGQSTTSSPLYSNPTGETIGNLGSLVTIASSLFGKGGLWGG